MELKYYDKSWLQAFKGGFLILLGILAMVQVSGAITTLAIFFSLFIGMTGVALIVAPIILKKKESRLWNIIIGVINLAFTLFIIIKIESPRIEIIWILLGWVIFNGITELVEAVILYLKKNAFAALFVGHALMSILFGYGLYIVLNDYVPEKVFNIGLIALVFGILNELSAYMLSRVKNSQ